MQLFVLRHGRAGAHRQDDASRELVDSGVADVRAVVAAHKAALAGVELWASPYVRARQTAAIAAQVLALESEPTRLSDNLVPSARVGALVDEIYRADVERLLIVSHQPLVSNLLDYLCGANERHDMPTAALACVELPVAAAELGQLQWLAHPGSF